MDTFLAALFSGTSRGAIYALVALGFNYFYCDAIKTT